MGFGMNKMVEGALGASKGEMIKYLDSIHARLERLNEQMDELLTEIKNKK